MPPPERQPRREGGAAGAGGGAGEDLAEDRIALRADAEALAVGRVHALRGLGALEGGDVVRMVEAGERVRRGARAVDVAFRVEPAEGADQVERGGNARDGERVLRPVGGAAVDLRADQQRRRAARVREHGRPPVQYVCAAPAMARKSAATRLAPPTRAPSTFSSARIASALAGFTEPP